jgi:hypothetical protein
MNLKQKLTKLWDKIPSKVTCRGCRYSLWGLVLLGLVSFACLVMLLVIICHHPDDTKLRAQRAIAFVPLSIIVFFCWWVIWSFREKMDVLPRTAGHGPVGEVVVREIVPGGSLEPKICIKPLAGVVGERGPRLCKCIGLSQYSPPKRSISTTSSTSTESKMSTSSLGPSYNSYGLAGTISSNQSNSKPDIPEITPRQLLTIWEPGSGGFKRTVLGSSSGEYTRIRW